MTPGSGMCSVLQTPHRMGSIASVVTPDYGGLLAPLLYEDGSVLSIKT